MARQKQAKAQQAKPQGRQTNTAFGRVQQLLKLVDLVIEVVDARAPLASRHPRAADIFGNKPRLIVLSKEDLAEAASTKFWTEVLSTGETQKALSLRLKSEKNRSRLVDLVLELTAKKRADQARKGLLPRPARVCVAGIPNTGKSSLINWLIGQKRVRTGDTPGITKGPQWVRVHPQIDLLDTPGVLPAEEFRSNTKLKLALLNLVTPNSYDFETTAREGLELIARIYPERLKRYLGLDSTKALMDTDLTLTALAQRKNLIMVGGKPDEKRAAALFLNELRNGKLGLVSLETPVKPHAESHDSTEGRQQTGL